MKETILVTGGAGYIGSHACLALAEAGYEAVIIDNFANSDRSSLDALQLITGAAPIFLEGDIRDAAFLDSVFARFRISTVMHFAGLKAVGESVAIPLEYYEVNVGGTLEVLKAMQRAGVRSIIFSSSATVYGDCKVQPVTEASPRSATNPYGQTKLVVEYMLEDLCGSDPEFGVASLRYFNPVGAHKSGVIGENPRGVPANLMPFVAQVATGQRPYLNVFGSDYETVDGTGVRDFIHVVDLVEGHVAALKYLKSHKGFTPINLGVGRGVSVLEMVAAFEAVSGRKVEYRLCDRRPGDVAASYADPANANALLGWRAVRSVEEMCADTWRWQQHHAARNAAAQA